jgi:hypothetical protein
MADSISFTIKVEGLDGMIDAMETLTKPPSFKVTAKFEAALKEGFEITQAQTHVISGRLKASGRTKTDMKGSWWAGSILYGGESGTPAYYAIYELNRGGTRPDGTPHDFFSGLSKLDSKFEEAVDYHFRPLKGDI